MLDKNENIYTDTHTHELRLFRRNRSHNDWFPCINKDNTSILINLSNCCTPNCRHWILFHVLHTYFSCTWLSGVSALGNLCIFVECFYKNHTFWHVSHLLNSPPSEMSIQISITLEYFTIAPLLCESHYVLALRLHCSFQLNTTVYNSFANPKCLINCINVMTTKSLYSIYTNKTGKYCFWIFGNLWRQCFSPLRFVCFVQSAVYLSTDWANFHLEPHANESEPFGETKKSLTKPNFKLRILTEEFNHS